MFKDSEAFSGYSIDDVEACREFYQDKLGLEVTDVAGMEAYGMLELHIEGSRNILLYHKDDHEPASFTVLSFPVDDINAAVDDLAAKGIQMQHFDTPGMHQDERGIMRGIAAGQGPDIAWFTDPSGNSLAVLQNA